MSDRWLKPDFQEIAVAGECTAYAGTQGACEANNHGIITVDPLKEEGMHGIPVNHAILVNHGIVAVDPLK
jgi:hypothetical protein